MKIMQKAFVVSMRLRFLLPQNLAIDQRESTRRRAIGLTSWWSVVNLGGDATGYSECIEGSGPTCPQSGPTALRGGSKDNCLPQDNQGSGGCFPAGRGLDTVAVR